MNNIFLVVLVSMWVQCASAMQLDGSAQPSSFSQESIFLDNCDMLEEVYDFERDAGQFSGSFEDFLQTMQEMITLAQECRETMSDLIQSSEDYSSELDE